MVVVFSFVPGVWALHKSISLFCDLEVPKPPTLLLWNTLEIPGILGAHHQNFSRCPCHPKINNSFTSFLDAFWLNTRQKVGTLAIATDHPPLLLLTCCDREGVTFLPADIKQTLTKTTQSEKLPCGGNSNQKPHQVRL
jgi:hypothetical protein